MLRRPRTAHALRPDPARVPHPPLLSWEPQIARTTSLKGPRKLRDSEGSALTGAAPPTPTRLTDLGVRRAAGRRRRLGRTSRATAGRSKAEEAGNLLLASSGAQSRGDPRANPEGGALCSPGAGEAPRWPLGSGGVESHFSEEIRARSEPDCGAVLTGPLWSSLPRGLAPDPQDRGEALRPAGSFLYTSRSVDNYLSFPFGPTSPSLEVLPPSRAV